jgi:hypothetical protein
VLTDRSMMLLFDLLRRCESVMKIESIANPNHHRNDSTQSGSRAKEEKARCVTAVNQMDCEQ